MTTPNKTTLNKNHFTAVKDTYHLIDCAFLYCYSLLQDGMTANDLKVEIIHYLTMKDPEVVLSNNLSIEIDFLDEDSRLVDSIVDNTIIVLFITATFNGVSFPLKKHFIGDQRSAMVI